MSAVETVALTVPKFWALVAPCGCVDGLMRGSSRHTTAEATWKTFTPLKRDRERERRGGWQVRPATNEDVEASKKTCTHGADS